MHGACVALFAESIIILMNICIYLTDGRMELFFGRCVPWVSAWGHTMAGYPIARLTEQVVHAHNSFAVSRTDSQINHCSCIRYEKHSPHSLQQVVYHTTMCEVTRSKRLFPVEASCPSQLAATLSCEWLV